MSGASGAGEGAPSPRLANAVLAAEVERLRAELMAARAGLARSRRRTSAFEIWTLPGDPYLGEE